MSGKRVDGPRAGPGGAITVRVGSERLREVLLAMKGERDFRERMDEAFALGVRELKARTVPRCDDGIPTGDTDETTDGLYMIAGAADRDFVATEALNDALCAFMDAYFGYPETTPAHVPRFLLKPERDDDAESGDPDDEP